MATIGQNIYGLRDRSDEAARSEKKETAIETQAAAIYIGIVRSCAVVALYPRSLIIVGKKRLIPYNGQTKPQYIKRQTYSCQSVQASMTYFHLKYSFSAIRRPDFFEPWYFNRWTAQARSSTVRNLAVLGKSCRKKYERVATAMVRRPSRIKLLKLAIFFP